MLVVVVILFLYLGLASPCFSQDAAESQPSTHSSAKASSQPAQAFPAKAYLPISEAETYIYAARSRISAATVDQDKKALRMAFPYVWSRGKSDLTDTDSGKLLAMVWIDYRVTNAHVNSALSDETVVKLADGYGGIHITTNPKGASVWVDGKKWEGQTALTGFTTAGRRTLRLGGLPGYKDDEETIEVEATTILQINRDLSPK